MDPFRIITQKRGRQIAIDKAPRGRAQPEIVHKDSQGFAAPQESKSKFQCAKIFRTIYQDDVACLEPALAEEEVNRRSRQSTLSHSRNLSAATVTSGEAGSDSRLTIEALGKSRARTSVLWARARPDSNILAGFWEATEA